MRHCPWLVRRRYEIPDHHGTITDAYVENLHLLLHSQTIDDGRLLSLSSVASIIQAYYFAT